MRIIVVHTKIFNPEISEDLTIPVYESIEEAVQAKGKSEVLDIINAHLIQLARLAWRERTIKALQYPGRVINDG